MPDNPLVTICVPTYNRAEDLRQTLRTLKDQTYAPLDILVSDNGSTDHTEAVGLEAAAADPRIRFVRHPKNIRLYGNHNFCLDHAKGEFLSFFHDHDERDPGIITAFVRFLQAHPRVGVVSSDWDLIDERGEMLGTRDHAVETVTPGLSYIEQTIASGRSSIGIPGALVRREALGSIRFNEQGHIGFGDFVLWCEMAERWDVGHLPARLWRWRQHRRSQSARTIESLTRDYFENLNAYCDGHLARHPEHGPRVARWRRLINRYLFWALAYEVGLHFRHTEPDASPAGAQTLFEILDYRLSEQEFQQAVRKLRAYRTGPAQHAAYAGIRLLMRGHMTRPLAWATRHSSSVRQLLGLR